MNPLEADFLLYEPEPICRLDLSTARVEELPSALDVTKRVVHAGRMDGQMMYVKVPDIRLVKTWEIRSPEGSARSAQPGAFAASPVRR